MHHIHLLSLFLPTIVMAIALYFNALNHKKPVPVFYKSLFEGTDRAVVLLYRNGTLIGSFSNELQKPLLETIENYLDSKGFKNYEILPMSKTNII